MMEFYAVYRVSTGEYEFRNHGPKGSAALAAEPGNLPADCAVVEMPYEAWQVVDADLAPLKAAVQKLVDDAAGRFRRNFITTVPGQAETYLYKAEEARAWTADNSAAAPFLAPEAAARGMTVAELAAEVLANEAGWKLLGGRIEGARVSAKATIAAAGTIGAIVAASMVDWPALIPGDASQAG